MDNLARVRQASVRVARIQRRIWLLQTFVLPVVAIAGVVAAAAAGAWVLRRRAAATHPTDATPTPQPTQARLNGTANGNNAV